MFSILEHPCAVDEHVKHSRGELVRFLERGMVLNCLRVKHHHTSPKNLPGRVGVITAVQTLPTSEVIVSSDNNTLETQYLVGLDGDTDERFMWESWLEPVEPDPASL